METFITANEAPLRLMAFIGLLALFAGVEAIWPRRARVQPRRRRWSTNLAVGVINTLVLRLAVPVLAVGAAVWAQAHGIGLLNVLAVPHWLAFAVALVALDLTIYAQHVAFHRVPVLWRVHRMHHTDRDVDATTALRFHPVEIVISMGVKIAVVLALGAPPAAVILFEVVLNGMAMFNHANLRLPGPLDSVLRRVLVTPDMHRVHHSVIARETGSNFGFNLSIWDRLFGTYRDRPEKGHEGMTIGLAEYQDDWPQRLGFALWLPFARKGDAPRSGARP